MWERADPAARDRMAVRRAATCGTRACGGPRGGGSTHRARWATGLAGHLFLFCDFIYKGRHLPAGENRPLRRLLHTGGLDALLHKCYLTTCRKIYVVVIFGLGVTKFRVLGK
jgi:hypothetical protein